MPTKAGDIPFCEWAYRDVLSVSLSESEMSAAAAVVLATLIAIVASGSAQNFLEEFHADLQEAFDNSHRDDEEYQYFEWEGYDGWYNNPAHPDWGGAGIS